MLNPLAHRSVRASLLLALALVACREKPEPGATCKTNNLAACFGPTQAALCRAGQWTSLPCRGPQGCVEHGSAHNVTCDDSRANVGDACMNGNIESYACTADGKRALICSQGKFEPWRHCRGAKGCRVEGAVVDCDNSVAESADACGPPGSLACGADHRSLLLCHDGRMKTVSSCRGPKECTVRQDKRGVSCDSTIATEGDSCELAESRACSADGKLELVCKGTKFVRLRECSYGSCAVRDGRVACP